MRSLPLVVLIAACGPTYNFDGHWSGTWSSVQSSGETQGGFIDVSVANHIITGTCTTSYGATCTISGEAKSNGDLVLIYTVPGSSTATAKCTTEAIGSHVSCTCTLFVGGQTNGTLSADIARK